MAELKQLCRLCMSDSNVEVDIFDNDAPEKSYSNLLLESLQIEVCMTYL